MDITHAISETLPKIVALQETRLHNNQTLTTNASGGVATSTHNSIHAAEANIQTPSEAIVVDIH